MSVRDVNVDVYRLLFLWFGMAEESAVRCAGLAVEGAGCELAVVGIASLLTQL